MQGLRVVSLRKLFGDVAAVNDISFDVKPGEVVTLLGPSGCGKTTTLRMVAGLEQPTSGEIYLGDRLLSSPAQGMFVPPEQRTMGMVFQNYAVWPHMTVAENVGFPLRMKGVARSEIGDRVAGALKTVGLDGLQDRPSPMLSGGQQQRVALARAIVGEPEVLLLDEPLSNLDARLRDDLRFELKELQQRLNITTLFVTHDQKEAMVLADRIIVMSTGKIEQQGSPTEVYNHPATRFALEFLGESNYLRARVERRAGGTALSIQDANNATLTLTGPDEWPAGAEGQLSFRPEDVTLEAGVPGDPWSAVVETAAFLGSQFDYFVRLGSARLHLIGGKRDIFAQGQLVRVHLHPEGCTFWPDGANTSAPSTITPQTAAVH